jgi:Zn-finger nucleic acid-binding protein
MKCPQCNTNLMMSERNGIEIDYCPDCRGVWLDRGELDKIIERSSSSSTPNIQPGSFIQKPHYPKDDYRYKKKKGGFLDDLFDF